MAPALPTAPERLRRPHHRVLAAMVLAAVVLVACSSEPEDADDAAWPMTGMPQDGEPVERPAFAIKVSNSPEARPQTGLDRADVVLEELTEGGITRFMAVFHSDLPEVVGPIRSARPVDTQLISGFGTPGFAYSGARDEVRALLANTPAVTITEGAPGFFRDDGTYASHPVAPHDLFLRLADGLAAVTEAGAEPLTDLGWRFDAQAPSAAPDGDGNGDDSGSGDGSAIEIDMSPSFRSGWTYDEDAGVYRREQNGAPTVVTGPDRIGAANVVVLEVRHYVGGSGYPETDVLGDGPALVLRDGQRFAARWSKPEATSPLQLTTEDGSAPFPLKPGRTWIHLPERLPGA
jgi:hypothetical protein